MIAIGLDGFSKGWVAVTIDGDRQEIDFPEHVSWLATQRFDRAAIDMPIGLCERGIRSCDLAAREQLRPHASRVFTGARRSLFGHPTHAAANRDLAARGEARISIQLWGIVKKLREVDDFVGAHRCLDIRETHPELVFLRLNGRVPLASKHTTGGIARRCELLQAAGLIELPKWLNETRLGHGAKRDDVLDACAAALAARDAAAALPESPAPVDSHGLPMQICF